MKRRTFIAGLGSAVAWPVVARAQQGERTRRVGVLMNGAATDAVLQSYVATFVEGLRERGWIEGQTSKSTSAGVQAMPNLPESMQHN
jgi:putative ABC transport system substrate-binding protein